MFGMFCLLFGGAEGDRNGDGGDGSSTVVER